MSDESDADIKINKKRKRRISDSDSDDSLNGSVMPPGNVYFKESSDADSSFELVPRRKRIGRVTSDSESSNSGSEIIKLSRRMPSARLALTDSEKDGSDSDLTVSDFGDDQSEKCPICLKTFRTQEVGSPESCDHNFCIDCIQEWAKNMNTCPVDRQSFNLILVRKHYLGKVIRQIPVETPIPQNENEEIIEDPTYCEICGRCDGEDRMLLCDGCDLGFHLECLDPPLGNIPTGVWYCPDCGGSQANDHMIDIVELLFEDGGTPGWPMASRRSNTPRLIPRTRQSERVRARIITHRNNQIILETNDPQDIEPSENTSNFGISSYRNNSTGCSQETLPCKRKTKSQKRNAKRKRSIKITYEIDKSTGERIAVKTRTRRKRKRKANRRTSVPKTVKKRLAVSLGMCTSRQIVRSVPHSRSQNNIGIQRNQAGIPTLHLFGQRDELDYFSDSESEMGTGTLNLLIRRHQNMSEVALMRRAARRKAIALPTSTTNSVDLLGTILDNQTKLHSKNSIISVEKDGTVKINKTGGILNNNKVDINDHNQSGIKQTPMYSPQSSHESPTYSTSNDLKNNTNSQSNVRDSVTTSTSDVYGNPSSSNEQNNSGGYSEVPLYSFYETDKADNRKDKKLEAKAATSNSDSELDIYSDIETVSTSRDDFEMMKPPTPPILVMPTIQSDDEGNISDDDLVIDTEKIDEKSGTSTPIEYESKDEVSSTVDSAEVPKKLISSAPIASSVSNDIQSETVQSSSQIDEIYHPNRLNTIEGDEVASEDECPNFSIYSTESINLAKTTDLGLLNDQVTSVDRLPVDNVNPCQQTEKDSVDQDDDFENENKMNRNENSENDECNNDYTEGNSTVVNKNKKVKKWETDSVESNPDNVKPNENVEEWESDSVDDAVQNTNSEKEGENSDNANDKNENKVPKVINKCDEINDSLVQSTYTEKVTQKVKKAKSSGIIDLYSDSEDESVIRINSKQPFGIGDIRNMTEDISEEERSYTPCLDEKELHKEGLEGLDTELISDEERNDFDESHELKTVSDGDALEINAKESELDFTKPDDYEEGEIVDKNKNKQVEEPPKHTSNEPNVTQNIKKKETEESNINKENENNAESNFKKLSKSNKERNYRDKDKERSKSKDKRERSDKSSSKRGKKRERRKELERYDVRTIIAEKPRRLKDKFGRDIKRSLSRSSRSRTPPIRKSFSQERSLTRDRARKRKPRSRQRSSVTKSQSNERKSPEKRPSPESLDRHDSRVRTRKGQRSTSRKRKSRKKSRDRLKKSKKNKSCSRHRSRSVSPRRRRNWDRERRHSKARTPSLSRSVSPGPRNPSPSWTPPYLMENHQNVRTHSLTVILPNDANKKKKDKRKKIMEKRGKDTTGTVDKRRRRRNIRSPHPSKEVFASGDNILVSVSFNKENEERDVSKRKRDSQPDELTTKRTRKEKEKRTRERRKNRNQDIAGVKPVAIIDLDRSPFKEITPSPKDVIVLTDSEIDENNVIGLQQPICDLSEQAVSPERLLNSNYSTGPKTPPEPQVKFSLNSKQPQLRVLNNPLHEPDDVEGEEIDPQEELEQRLNDVMHKGPNTPPEPPNSPPSSPDAYDPFDPTKSRSPTPEPTQSNVQSTIQSVENASEGILESRSTDVQEKAINESPEVLASHTPPSSSADIQPADSQSSVRVISPEKSPEHPIGVIINQVVQSQASIFPTIISKPMLTTSYCTSSISAAPSNSTNTSSSRVNILSSTILAPAVVSTLPQRIVLPNITKSSPVKVAPTKIPIKSSPIKPMPVKNIGKSNANAKPVRKSNNRNQNGADTDVLLDFESPYSPGSSDYEDLFEPPPESGKSTSKSTKNNKSPAKLQNAFESLFGSSPVHGGGKKKQAKHGRMKANNPKHKVIGIKLDEDHLRILDEVPNSAVEMQVKDKFLKKLNRQERVVEEVKLVLKPHYNKKHITKEEYKDILRRAVPKICHNRSGEINPKKIQNLIEAYVKKIRHSKKVTSSSSVNPQKV